MNEGLSRLVAGIYAQAKAGEDLPSVVSRFRTLIKKVIEGEDTVFGKLRALVDSFRDVIPDDRQRYEAAIKALSTTAKLSRDEIMAAVNKQFEDLKVLEKVVIAALPRGPEELKAMETRSQRIKGEIARLHEKIAQLEKEENEIARSMAGREKEAAGIETALREVFAGLSAEILAISEKVGDAASMQPITAVEIQTANNAQKSMTCPMCGGQMTYSTTMRKWRCASCANESHEKSEPQSKAPEPVAPAVPPAPAPAAAPEQQPDVQVEQKTTAEPAHAAEPHKACPICGGRMDYYFAEKKWQCFSCGEEDTEDIPDDADLSKAASSRQVAPVPDVKQTVAVEQADVAEPAPDSEVKQKCPMCGGRMDYYIAENKWQCFSCGFESHAESKGLRVENDGGERSGQAEAIPVITAGEHVFDNSLAGRAAAKQAKSRAPIKKKTCPGCGRKMYFHEENRSWECNDCGYVRRV